jgi:hypothetical protein
MVEHFQKILWSRDKIIWDHKENWIPCIAHIINLVVQRFLNTTTHIEAGKNLEDFALVSLIAKVRSGAKAIRSSPQRWEEFKSYCQLCEVPPLKIYIDVATRWNSVHCMLE